MYKVKNKSIQTKKFRNMHVGVDIYVKPNKYVLTNYPPKESEVWEINIEEKEKKKKLNLEEDK